jgi:hypothetical protein
VGATTLGEIFKGPAGGADNLCVSSWETRLRVLLTRLPVTGTSALGGMVAVVALALVVLGTVTPTHPGGHSAVRGHDTRPAVALRHPQAVAPPTTAPPAPTTTAPTVNPGALASASPPAPPPPPPPPAPKPAPKPAPVVTSHPIVPPNNPSSNIAPSPDFLSPCRQSGWASGSCMAAVSQATTSARGREGLGALALPSNFASLTPGEQLFVLTDIERVDRGLPPVVGMVQELNQDAQSAAAGNTDPTPVSVPPGTTVLRWASNWAEAAGPTGANYMWMYDDGPGSGNLSCTSTNSASCWGHRDNELGFGSSAGGVLIMGAAEATVPADAPWSSDAELIALVTGNPTFTYTWAQAQAAGAR